jgi:hypothetical protein
VLNPTDEGKYLFMAAGGLVTILPPGAGTVQIVGVLALGGGAGTSEMIYQPLVPTTF